MQPQPLNEARPTTEDAFLAAERGDVDTLKRLHSQYDHIFTSGGVGPTHDDITLESIGLALERKVVVSPMLEKFLKLHYKTDLLTPAQQRLAWICEGSTLHYGPESLYPQVVVDRVYPLPGIPELFRKKFDYFPG